MKLQVTQYNGARISARFIVKNPKKIAYWKAISKNRTLHTKTEVKEI